MSTKRIHLIAAARPNFMKVAPLYHALVKDSLFDVEIVHTGQHYDANMSAAFFADLELPTPHHHLEVGSGTHAEQTGGVIIAYEQVCMSEQPDCVIVVGDVNSTAAVAMVCAKLLVPLVHLEAGLRSGDRTMPEEINRLVTDAIADLLWTPSPDGDENLRREGVPASRIERVGNIMIDSFELLRSKIEADDTRERMGLHDQRYGVVTLHRPSNVDDRNTLQALVDQLENVTRFVSLIFSVHPRTLGKLKEYGLYDRLAGLSGMTLMEPVGYIQFMNLVLGATIVITDSGGIQEETTYLGIPCLTLRPNTERPITITEGTNLLVEPKSLLAEVNKVLEGGGSKGQRPDLWDGQTAGRCVESLRNRIFGEDKRPSQGK
jgi:UDP-N-acetylglucosamine 2-epimerase (non-hydrolysing)